MMTQLANIPSPKLDKCQKIVSQRLKEMPKHDLFQYFSKQLNFIKSNLNPDGKLSKDIYEKLNIGVLCAKELEHFDSEFCDAIYEMLEEVGPKIVWDF